MNIPDGHLRQFLVRYFNEDELDDLCFDFFPAALQEFASGMPVGKKARLLIAYANRHGQHDLLIAAVSRLRPNQFSALASLMARQNSEPQWTTDPSPSKAPYSTGALTSLTAHSKRFTLGNRTFPFQVIDGDGESSYTSSSITCVIDPRPLELLPEVEVIREHVARREEDKKNNSEDYVWNGAQYALKRYVIGRTVPHEEMELRLVFQNTDYYTFQATVRSLDLQLADGTTLRKKYLTPPPEDPVPSLAIGFGIAMVLFTSDKKLLLSRRTKKAGVRPGELDVSVVEGILPGRDLASNGTDPDIYGCAVHGAKEEVGVTLQRQDVRFLGFGVDHEYYQWNMIGMASLPMTAKEVIDEGTRGSPGRWEVGGFSFVDADPDVVWRSVQGEKLWAMGWVALYWSLVHEFGKAAVDQSARLHVR